MVAEACGWGVVMISSSGRTWLFGVGDLDNAAAFGAECMVVVPDITESHESFNYPQGGE